MKTCGECIHADVCERNPLYTEFDRGNPAYCKDFRAEQKWIPVTERLPEKNKDVLLYFGFKHKNQAVGFWEGEEKQRIVFWRAYTDDGFYTDCDYSPTHWMPLPQPPKEGE